jgi:ribosomal protein L16 Arg81 hydroxylase
LARVTRERSTIKIEGVDRLIPDIRAALDALSDALATPIRRSWANLYVSGPDVGVAAHVDGHEVIAVQLAGSKQWTLRQNGTSRSVTLQRGSVLFVPRGIEHETHATELSVSLSLSFDCYTLADVALHGLARLMRSPEWTCAAGGIQGDFDGQRVKAFDSQLRDLGAKLASEGALGLSASGERVT